MATNTLNIPEVEASPHASGIAFLNYNGARVRVERFSAGNMNRKPRVYGSAYKDKVEALVGFSYDDLKSGLKGEDPDMDKLWSRWNRAEVRVMREDAEKTLFAAGIDNGEGTLKFSRKAGCSLCPCSPGFILENSIEVDVPGKGAHVVTEIFPK